MVPDVVEHGTRCTLGPQLRPKVRSYLGTIGPLRIVGTAGPFRSIGWVGCEEFIEPVAGESLVHIRKILGDGEIQPVRRSALILCIL